MKRDLTISVVIPAFNETDYIEDCLKSLKNQTRPADEIIVVNNNSSDDTASKARKFPGVRVVNEPRQGRVYARSRGFDETSSTIIARIDADTVVDKDWLQEIEKSFKGGAEAVTNTTGFYDVRLPALPSWLMRTFFFGWNKWFCGRRPLFGSNMAIKKDSWNSIVDRSYVDDRIWEDLDLALQLQGVNIDINPSLRAWSSLRSAKKPAGVWLRYMLRWPRTYYRRDNLRGTFFAFVGMFCLLPFAPIVIISIKLHR